MLLPTITGDPAASPLADFDPQHSVSGFDRHNRQRSFDRADPLIESLAAESGSRDGTEHQRQHRAEARGASPARLDQVVSPAPGPG